MKELFAGEDPAQPMSDGHVAELLAEQGFVVARRTVAKHTAKRCGSRRSPNGGHSEATAVPPRASRSGCRAFLLQRRN